MRSRWTIKPVTVGAFTRYLVHRKDGSELRGIWEKEKEAIDLVDKLNFHEFGDKAVIDDVDFD